MKRLLIPLFLVTFVIFLMLGCDVNTVFPDRSDVDSTDEGNETPEVPEEEHVHAYVSVITEPTEERGGYTTHTCECGDEYVDSHVDPLPLSLKYDPVYQSGALLGYSVSGYSYKKYVDVVVPATYEGMPVLSVKEHGFQNITSLESIELPNGMTEIGRSAFDKCTELKSISIPPSVKTIGDYAFYHCDSLESVSFAENSMLNSLSTMAFSYCESLRSVTLPSKLSTCGDDAFLGCKSIEYNEYDNALYIGNSQNPYLMLMKAKDTAITSCEIHEDTKFIYKGAFEKCLNLNKIVIPDNTEVIMSYAFIGSGIRSVKLGTSLREIRDSAFKGCYCLVEVMDLSSNISLRLGKEDYGHVAYYALEVHSEMSKLVKDGDYLFYTLDGVNRLVGTTLTDSALVLPESYKGEDYVVHDYAFYLNDTITSVTMSGEITALGAYAFAECTELSTVQLSDRILEIGEGCFSKCSSLESIAIPDSVKKLGPAVFVSCTSLSSVSLGDGLEGSMATLFVGCTSLESVVIPYGVTSIGGVFQNCTNLKSVEIPDSVTNIGYACFDSCSSLVEIKLPSNLEVIDNEAFHNCAALRSLTLPETLTTVGESAFAYCTSLEGIYIPESVTAIGSAAFIGCSSLTYASLGSVTKLEDYLFDDCTALLEIVIPDTVTTSGIFVFAGCKSLESVSFGIGITQLGDWMFNRCESLVSVVVPENVSEIGSRIFDGCTSLTSIEFKCSDLSPGVSVLNGCSSLRHVTLWDGIKQVSSYFFGECTNLVSVVLPSSINQISYNAFYLAESLESVYFTGTAEEWAALNNKDKTEHLSAAAIYFYSEAEPAEEGNYWCYGENGEIVVW